MLGRRINREAGADPMASHRRDVDEMTCLLLFHVGQRRGDAVQNALDIDVDHQVPFVDFETFKQGLRHQPGVVDHHVDPPVGLHGGVYQSLDLVVLNDIRRYGECLAATAAQPNALRRSMRRAPSTTLAPCAERSRAVASPSPLLAPVMTTIFPSMLFIILTPALHSGRSAMGHSPGPSRPPPVHCFAMVQTAVAAPAVATPHGL